MKQLSIIIPVYNVEKYISKCLGSIITQDLTNIEVILVNDGSTDNSVAKIEKYVKDYSTVKVLHKSNGGLSDARNYGLQHASGKYVMFLDSDDWIDSNCLNELLGYLEEDLDLIVGNYVMVYEDGEQKKIEPFNEKILQEKEKSKIIKYMFEEYPGGPWSVWKYIIKKELLDTYKLSFKKGLLCEDVDFTPNLYIYSEKIKIWNSNFYFYRCQREGSIMNIFSFKRSEDFLSSIKKWKFYFKTNQENQYIKLYVFNALAKSYRRELHSFIYLNKVNEKKYMHKLLYDEVDIISLSTSDILRKERKLIKLIGGKKFITLYKWKCDLIKLKNSLNKLKR